jgi:transposase
MDIHEVLRLLRDGASDREITSLVGLNRRTVARYRRWATDQQLLAGAVPLPQVAELAQQLAATLPAVVPPQQTSTVAAYQSEILQLRQQGVELAAIRARLEERHGQPISYDAIWRLVQRLERDRPPEAFVRVEVPPGSEAQVDFGYAGRQLDPATGALRKAWVFVLVLSWSRHLYAEVVFDQSVATWLLCHQHAFSFLQGVPERIVLDNLKAAILHASANEPVVQQAYRECAEHYGFWIDPNPPRTPRLKGKVESGVHYVKRAFLAGREPTRLDDLNALLRTWCTVVAGQRLHGTTNQRPVVQFQQTEQAALRALPRVPYDLAIWKQVQVPRDGHAVFEGSYYSAPYRLIGQRLWVRGGSRTVDLFDADQRLVATHDRASQPGERHTNPVHLPPHKVPGLLWSRSVCQEQADAMGPATSQVIADLLAHRPVDRLKVAQRVLKLAERHTPERLEQACARALAFGSADYPTIKRILAAGTDAAPVVIPAPPPTPRNLVFLRQASEFAAGLLAAAGGRR